MKREIVIEHVSLEIHTGFDHFTYQFEKALGILMPAALVSLGATPASVVRYLDSVRDGNSLMIYNLVAGEDLTHTATGRKIKQYQLGNPAIMRRMTDEQAGVGLYMPIHLLVYENEPGKVMAEYDRPASQCAQFKNPALLADSLTLENKLIALIKLADESLTN